MATKRKLNINPETGRNKYAAAKHAELFAAVCAEMELHGNCRRAIRDVGFNMTEFYKMLRMPANLEQYTRSKSIGMETGMSDEMIDLADSTRTNGSSKAKPDNTDRSRLQLDTRKWLLSKLVPKKFGDKVDVNHGGNLVVAFDKDDKGVL